MDNFTDDASPKAGVPTGDGGVEPWRPIIECPQWLLHLAKRNPPQPHEPVVKNFNFGPQFATIYWDQEKGEPGYFMLREYPR